MPHVKRLALLAVLSLASTACSILGLKPQLEEAQQILYYTGTVERQTPGQGPIVVVLYSTAAGHKIVFYDVVPRQGVYHLLARPGEYAIVAFEDANRDFIYSAGERIGYLDGMPVNAQGDTTGAARGHIVIPAKGGKEPAFPIDLSAHGLAATMPSRAARIGALITLEDTRFDKQNVEKGIYRPMDFLRDLGPGLFLLEPYDPQRIPVIFVHGMDGSPRDWTTIIGRLDRSRLQPWVYYWPTGMSLQFSAWVLDEAIQELRARHGFDRIYLVAHSMGGLVSRGAINFWLNDGRQPLVERFITISTPWKGHAAAELGVKTAPVVVPSWKDMAPGSPYLQSLFSTPWPDSIEVSLLFSHHGKSAFTPGKDDGVVSVDSMLAYEAQDRARFIYGFSENHTAILSSEKTLEKLDLLLADRPPAN